MSAHTPPGEKHEFCLFGDVEAMNQTRAYCYTCQRDHSTTINCDVWFVGPSCKNISRENANAANYADCYTSGDGCSGVTYRLGCKQAIQNCCPAVAFFENTKGVAECVKNSAGEKQRPRIEVQGYENNIYIYRYRHKNKTYFLNVDVC